MDPATQVAVIGLVGTVLVAIIGAGVAYLTSRTEKRNAVAAALGQLKDERILLRDEQIAELKEDLAERDQQIALLRARLRAITGSDHDELE